MIRCKMKAITNQKQFAKQLLLGLIKFSKSLFEVLAHQKNGSLIRVDVTLIKLLFLFLEF